MFELSQQVLTFVGTILQDGHISVSYCGKHLEVRFFLLSLHQATCSISWPPAAWRCSGHLSHPHQLHPCQSPECISEQNDVEGAVCCLPLECCGVLRFVEPLCSLCPEEMGLLVQRVHSQMVCPKDAAALREDSCMCEP